MKFLFYTRKKEGSLMIELMVAATLMMIGLLGIFSLVTRSTGMNKDVVHRFEATYLAAEGIEIMKHIIDTDVAIPKTDFFNTTLSNSGKYEVYFNADRDIGLVSTGLSSSTRKLYLNDADGMYNYQGGTLTPYIRTVVVTSSADEITIQSVVEWMVGKEKNQVDLRDVFKNWREGVDG
jgi:Tfp pilus assembly protein PilV